MRARNISSLNTMYDQWQHNLGRISRISKMTIMLLMMTIDNGGDVNVDYYVDNDKDSDNKDNNDHAEIRDAPLYHNSISQEIRNSRPIYTE